MKKLKNSRLSTDSRKLQTLALKTHLAMAIFPYFLLQSHCLLITDQPEFNRHPQNKTKKEGENVTFSC